MEKTVNEKRKGHVCGMMKFPPFRAGKDVVQSNMEVSARIMADSMAGEAQRMANDNSKRMERGIPVSYAL